MFQLVERRSRKKPTRRLNMKYISLYFILSLRVGYVETQRCEFKSRSRQRIFRCRLQCQINMNLVFHISEDGSEVSL